MSCPSFPGCAVAPVELPSIVGTAPREEGYLLFECPKPWPKKIKKIEGLPQALRKVLKRYKEIDFKLVAAPSFPWPSEGSGPRALILRWKDGTTVCKEVEATPDAVTAGLSDPDWGEPRELFLVCTHGSRDSCCGLKGVPIYQNLVAKGSRAVLQASHLGGHRFAPVIAAFPEWRFFGHLSPQESLEMAECLDNNKPYLKGYRGNGRLDKRLQAVEAKLWEKYGDELFSVEELSGNKEFLKVRATLRGGQAHIFSATLKYFVYHAYKSCKDFRKEKMSELKLPLVEELQECALDEEPSLTPSHQ